MTADRIARCIFEVFNSLPSKAKPRTAATTQEWTILSGTVLSKGTAVPRCISLGTGMRCLPANKLPLAHGRCLHDWHAEIVAIRAFNLFLLNECSKLATSNAPEQLTSSEWVCRRPVDVVTPAEPQPFAIHDDVTIDMYISEAPCGDASMELVMQAQADSTPWTGQQQAIGLLDGRGYFSHLGVVRRKPARGDAPPTNSKSCSDKLAMNQCTSLLSSLTSLFIHPGNAYLHSLVLPQDQCISASLERCFGRSGRLSPVVANGGGLTQWPGGYGSQPFAIKPTKEAFSFGRATEEGEPKRTGCNITASWTPNKLEVLIGGTRSGFKQFSERGASSISRAKTWQTCLELASALQDDRLIACLGQATYADVKNDGLLRARRLVKQEVIDKCLPGWIKNDGDDQFAMQ